MKYITLRVAAILSPLATLTISNVALAQKGFVLGVHSIAAPGVSITGDDVDGEFKTDFGMGAGVTLGYGFNRRLTAYASLDVAKQRFANTDYDGATFGLGHIEAGVRASFPLGTTATIPYVSGSMGRRALGAHVNDVVLDREYDLSLSGTTYGLGGGVEHFFSPTMALDLGVSANFGRFDKYDADGEKDTAEVNGSRTIRMRVGVNWRPGARGRGR